VVSIDINVLASGAVVAATILTILTVVVLPMVKKLRKLDKGWDDFMRDWKGEEAEPGRDHSPGVMERLNNIDGEFKKNSGSTLKDAVARIERKLDEVDERLKKGDERMTRIESKLEKDS
jgi:tetrahydromethanopterin S-methyltransferase subunit B